LDESLRWYREAKSSLGAALVFAVRAEVALGYGALDEAQSLGSESLALARAVGAEGIAAAAGATLGRIALARGARTDAEALLREAFAALVAADDFDGAPRLLESFAHLAVAGGNPLRAARLFGAAASRRERLGLAIWPSQAIEHERLVRDVRSALEPADYDDANAAGRREDLEALLAEPFMRTANDEER
jgi:hypothetical protein